MDLQLIQGVNAHNSCYGLSVGADGLLNQLDWA